MTISVLLLDRILLGNFATWPILTGWVNHSQENNCPLLSIKRWHIVQSIYPRQQRVTRQRNHSCHILIDLTDPDDIYTQHINNYCVSECRHKRHIIVTFLLITIRDLWRGNWSRVWLRWDNLRRAMIHKKHPLLKTYVCTFIYFSLFVLANIRSHNGAKNIQLGSDSSGLTRDTPSVTAHDPYFAACSYSSDSKKPELHKTATPSRPYLDLYLHDVPPLDILY